MRIPAKADYAIRVLIELSVAFDGRAGGPADRPVSTERLAAAQQIAAPFLAGILGQLRLAGMVRSIRGPQGGFVLAKAAKAITIADVIRAMDGPLATLSGVYPDELDYPESAAALREVWVAVRANMRAVLEHTTIADVATAKLPATVRKLVANDDAWQRR